MWTWRSFGVLYFLLKTFFKVIITLKKNIVEKYDVVKVRFREYINNFQIKNKELILINLCVSSIKYNIFIINL